MQFKWYFDKKTRLHFWVVILAMIIQAALHAEKPPSEGHYIGTGDIDLFVFGGGTLIQGRFFAEALGSDNRPQFSCEFNFLAINISPNRFVSFSYDDYGTDPTIGMIRISDSEMNFRQTTDMPGCGNIARFDHPEGEDFKLDYSASAKDFSEVNRFAYSSVSRVTDDKVYFHSSTTAESRTPKYLLKNQVVLTGKTANGYTQAAYIGEQITIGWLPRIYLWQIWVE